jgi:predicted metal-dependent phosphoesterase TrpH
MTPGNIVGMAYVKGLQAIAITDHNSVRNAPAAIAHGNEYGLTVIPGMELTTSEEVHVVCLFVDMESASLFGDYVYERILPIKNREDIFGKQQVLDENDEEIERVERLLISATSISFDEVFDLVKSYGGIAFPAHIDKNANSLLSNLGFVPLLSDFENAEVHDLSKLAEIQKQHPYIKGCRILCNSDAHFLSDIHEPEYHIHAKSASARDIIAALEKRSALKLGLP